MALSGGWFAWSQHLTEYYFIRDVEEDTTIEAKSPQHQALFDTILTDIAPNTTGIQQVDQISLALLKA